MLVGNEMRPVTVVEKAFIASVMLTGNIINANIFGEMAVLVQVINRRSAAFQESIDSSNKVMKLMKVTQDVSSEIRDFFIQT